MRILKAAATAAAFLYKENHALDAWFKIAYGEEEEILLG